MQTVTTLPEAPKFKAFSATKDSIRVNWQGVKCDGYQLYMSENGGAYTKVATVKGASVGTYKIKNLKSGTKYTFKLRAYGRRADTNGVITSTMIKKSKSTQSSVVKPEYGTVTYEDMGWVDGWEMCYMCAEWKNGSWEISTFDSAEAFKFAKPYGTPNRNGAYERELVETLVYVYLG